MRDSGGDPTLPAVGGGLDETLTSTSGSPSPEATLPAVTSEAQAGSLPTISPKHYAFGKTIAEGGMGRIRAAHDLRLDRAVAIKELLVRNSDLRARFVREVRITARLQHPSIVSIYEAGQWPDGEPFLAMRMVPGRSLEAAIAAAATLEDRLGLLPNVLAAADALAYAHHEGVIHRDLKPSNVLVGEFGETVLIDWGLAKVIGVDEEAVAPRAGTDGSSLTVVGAVLGTPSYMPPEQARGETLDERADVYSLGAILYQLVTGRAPYVARKVDELLAAVEKRPPDPIRMHARGAPAELVAIVERAMARRVEDRFPTARELADELRGFLAGKVVASHRYSIRERVLRWLRKHVLVVLPLFIVIAGLVVLLLARRATRDTADRMARDSLVAQAQAVEDDVSFALDQADPVLATLKTLVNSAMPTQDAVARLHDAVLGRPGIYNASIAFSIGVMWGAYRDEATGELLAHESRVGDTETERRNYRVGAEVVEISKETSNYDPRKRPAYALALSSKKRVWMPPRVFSSSGKTGITVSEPVYGADGELAAVMTLDFNVEGLSKFISKAPLRGAHNVMFTPDGTILAYPSVEIPPAARAEKRLLQHTDFDDPALTALFAALGKTTASEQRFMHLRASNGDYFASIAVVHGKRNGTDAPLDWYLATLVPEATLFGTMKRLNQDAIIASGFALAILLAIALVFALDAQRVRRRIRTPSGQ